MLESKIWSRWKKNYPFIRDMTNIGNGKCDTHSMMRNVVEELHGDLRAMLKIESNEGKTKCEDSCGSGGAIPKVKKSSQTKNRDSEDSVKPNHDSHKRSGPRKKLLVLRR